MKQDKISTISRKFPTYRDDAVKTIYKWLDGKRIDDEAEGLWRIHDSLYDLTDFINRHPGGKDWLRLTKGTDITEAFETHHITLKAEQLLPKFKIRDAKEPRNIKLTFKDDGFYRTLKRRVREELPHLDYAVENTTKLIIDTLLFLTFIGAVVTARTNNYIVAIVTAVFLTWSVISSHNFFHQKDNWRMMIFNLSFMSYREWRVSHAMSHHLYTNSFHDLEISMFEPFFVWLPHPELKGALQRFGSWFYAPIFYALLYFFEFVKRVSLTSFTERKVFFKEDLIPFLVPLTMYYFGTQNIGDVIKMWLFIILIASYTFSVIGLNAAHHHPDIVHDGDTLSDGLDWGVYQLDTVMERSDIKGNLFFTLTHFGDHALHHLFPTLDHGVLPQLDEILEKTCEEFKTESTSCSWLHHIIGQHRQLARITTKKKRQVKSH